MATTTLTMQTFADTVRDHDIVLVDFWAEWCGPCRSFAPTYEEVAGEHPDIVFGKVDTDAEQELSTAFEIMSIPTLMVFREGVLLYSQAGALPPAALRELVSKVQEVDMDAVHGEIARRERDSA